MKTSDEAPEQKPWIKYRALTPRRLTILRATAWDVQHRVAATMDWAHGEDQWIAGCKGYKQRVTAFTLAASAEYADWLSVGFIDGRFVLNVLGIPIRIYGAPEDADVPKRYAHPTSGEVRLLNGAYELFDLPPSDRVWRLEVIHDEKARPLDVILAQVDTDGERHDPFVIPAPLDVVHNADSEETSTRSFSTTKPRKRPIELPAPELTSRKELQEKSKDSSAEGPRA